MADVVKLLVDIRNWPSCMYVAMPTHKDSFLRPMVTYIARGGLSGESHRGQLTPPS